MATRPSGQEAGKMAIFFAIFLVMTSLILYAIEIHIDDADTRKDMDTVKRWILASAGLIFFGGVFFMKPESS